MLKVESLDILAPAIADRILQVFNMATIPPYIVVENRSDSLTASIEYQESNDGSTWTTIVGTSQFISPQQANGQIVVSTKAYIALFASGNAPLNVHVARQYNVVSQVQPI